jgi:small subunit ribosomal protein S4
MGRYTGPSCKLCRREGTKLFLKGDRCFMAKCPIETGRPAPGMHGQRRGKTSDYGTQLREKQKLRRIHGMREGQFRVFFQRALKKRGVTGEALLQSLECRLDTIVHRLGFAPSRKAARQFVRHRHVQVNGHVVDIPSTNLRAGDVVQVRDNPRSRAYAARFVDTAESRGRAAWLSFDKTQFQGELLHVPTRAEIAPMVNEQLIVELYSK